MALVVIGHVIEPVIGRFEWVKLGYNYIYLFHMPLFAYVSGVLSSRELDVRRLRNVLLKLVFPYIFLELAYTLFDYYLFHRESLSFSLLQPYWILWYLFSLILWRALLPFFSVLRFPIGFAVLAGLAVGINNYGYNLSFSRSFVFFPFFLVGHYYHQRILAGLQGWPPARKVAVLVLLLTLLGGYLLDAQLLNSRWFYGSVPYSQFGYDWQTGSGYRLLTYTLALVLCVAFLALMPVSSGWTARLGRESLSIYILHGFVMKLLIASGIYSSINQSLEVILLALASLLLLPLLASTPARWFGRLLMNPLGSWTAKLLMARDRSA